MYLHFRILKFSLNRGESLEEPGAVIGDIEINVENDGGCGEKSRCMMGRYGNLGKHRSFPDLKLRKNMYVASSTKIDMPNIERSGLQNPFFVCFQLFERKSWL